MNKKLCKGTAVHPQLGARTHRKVPTIVGITSHLMKWDLSTVGMAAVGEVSGAETTEPMGLPNTERNQGPQNRRRPPGSLHEEKVESDALPKVIPDLSKWGSTAPTVPVCP